MAIPNAFREALKSGNVEDMRIMMKNSLLVDRSFKEFAEMELIASQVSNFYDTHDGRELINEESLWDDNYMNKLMVQIVGNFSHERVEHLKKVVRKLRPVPATQPSAVPSAHHRSGNSQQKYQYSPQRSYQEQKAHDQRSGSYREAKIAGGAVVGAVVGGMIATPVIGAAVGAVLGGAIVAVVTKEEH